MVHFKVLPRRKASDKVLRDEAFNFAKTANYNTPKKGLVSIVYKFFDFFFLNPFQVTLLKKKLFKTKN